MVYDDLAPFEGSDEDRSFAYATRGDDTMFFYADVGETLRSDVESEDHEGAMAGTSTWYMRELDLEGYDAAAEVRRFWDDGLEVKADKDKLYAVRDGEVDIWKAHPRDGHNEDTEYEEGPNETRPLEEISDERALELLGGA
ncbi:MAG: hypothetical protein ABEJ87_01015 [Candidatus Nanohalobium sp.]